MQSGELEHGLELRGFAGEDRVTPEHLLPAGVSPEALNIDYQDGTIRKRGGVNRLSRHNLLGGGLWVRRNGAAWGGILNSNATGFSLSGTLHTYECVVEPIWRLALAGNDFQLWRHITTGADGTGLWLAWDTVAYYYEARVQHSGGTLAVRGAQAFSGVPRVVTVSFDTATGTLRLQVGGASSGNTDDSDTIGAETYTAPSSFVRLGGESTHDDGVEAVLSDFRIWEGTVASSLQNDLRALLASEQTSALVAWWPFIPELSSDLVGRGLATTLNVSGGSAYWVDGYTAWPDARSVDAVRDAKFSLAWYLVMAASRSVVYEGQMRANTVMNMEARVGQRYLALNDVPHRMQLLPHREYVVAMNGYGPNVLARWGGSGAVGWLSYPAPTASSAPTATAAGSGGSLSAGDYLYQYALYNSTTGVVSAVGLFTSSVTAVLNDSVTIDLTSGGFLPDRHFPGADKIRIYRTTAGGTAFYFLVDKNIENNTHVDSAADSTLTELAPDYVGYAAPSRFGFVMDDRLWLGHQTGAESRLVYTERYTLADFYAENYLDVGYGDGDELVGGFGVSDRAVVFKRRSMWLVSGGGAPEAFRLAVGVGCVQHATIAAAHDQIFWMGEGGVYTMALPPGSGSPESLTGNAWREFFAAFTDADYEECAGVWDPINERYLLGVRVDGVRKTLVYTRRTRAWALWDLEATAFTTLFGGGTNRVYGGWRGYLSELDTGLNDGGNPHGTAHAASGTVTSATSTTLTDSGATWTAVSDVVNGRVSGLNNLTVTVRDADGENAQSRTVIDNTGTTLTVSEAWDVTPESGWTYAFGEIEGRWRSPRLQGERWDRRGRLDRVRVLNVVPEEASGDESTVYVSVDGGAEETFENPADSRYVEHGVRAGYGREYVVGVRQTSAAQTFEVGALALPFQPGEGI